MPRRSLTCARALILCASAAGAAAQTLPWILPQEPDSDARGAPIELLQIGRDEPLPE